MEVRIRTRTGQNRRRAGLVLTPSWVAYEVTPEQLDALRADKAGLEVDEALAQAAAAIEGESSKVAQLEAEVAQLREQLTAVETSGLVLALKEAQARIAHLEGELAASQDLTIEVEAQWKAAEAKLAAVVEAPQPAAPAAP